MVILGLERPVEYGSRQIFDPTMANMVLNAQNRYVQAMKEDYLQGREDLKEFNKEYGDFISPFRKDMARYGEIIGGIKDKINQAYANGIDPLRSPEGRAMITRLISSVDPAEFNMMKSNAKTGYAYLDALQALRKAGKFSQDQENFDIALNGETPFDDFSTSGPGGALNTWGRTSPIQATTLTDLAKPHYEHRTPRVLTKADFDSDPRLKNYKWDPRYEWKGYIDSDLMKVAPGASNSLKGDPRAAFFREQSKQKALAANPNATEADIEAQWQRDIADASAWALVDPTREADQFALDDHRTANDIGAARAKAAIEFEYDKKRLTDPVFKAAARASGGGGGRRKDEFNPNIFREAEARTPDTKGIFYWGTKAGDHVGYIPSGQYGELIDPILPAAYVQIKDKDSGQMIETWRFNDPKIKDRLYVIDENNNVKRASIENTSQSTRFDFIPDGQIKAARAGSGYRYYISGQMKGNKASNVTAVKGTGSTQVWIEVKERGNVYDGK